MKQIYIIRHGQSLSNAQQQIAGRLDSPLSELGKRQSALAGQIIKQYFSIDCILYSPLARTHETADIIANKVGLPASKLVRCDELRERDLGALEGKHYQMPSHTADYELAEKAEGIEPIELLAQRAGQALRQALERPEAHILLVTHNGLGRMLQTVAQQQPPLAIYHQDRLENAIIYPLKLSAAVDAAEILATA